MQRRRHSWPTARVPLEFTPQDFQEIAEGKYLVKVIYLPDPQFQELAATGTDEIISTRFEPEPIRSSKPNAAAASCL